MTTYHKDYGGKYLPVNTAQPAAAASDMLWPARPGKKDPPTTAMEVIPYKYLNSPMLHVEMTSEDLAKSDQNIPIVWDSERISIPSDHQNKITSYS